MTSKQPPRIATWMLTHFGSGAGIDTVLGDLAEQYPQKDSAMWYWRQAIKAIPVTLFKEIRGHKWIAARALLTGWGIWVLCGVSILRIVSPFFFGAWGVMWNPALGGGVLARPLDNSAEFPHVYPFVFAVAFPLMVGAMSGWLVARFHRVQQTSVVLLFAGSILLMDLVLLVPLVLFAPPAAYAFIGPLAANVASSVLGILLGGGLFGIGHDKKPPAFVMC
jgi:hypothetical protein